MEGSATMSQSGDSIHLVLMPEMIVAMNGMNEVMFSMRLNATLAAVEESALILSNGPDDKEPLRIVPSSKPDSQEWATAIRAQTDVDAARRKDLPVPVVPAPAAITRDAPRLVRAIAAILIWTTAIAGLFAAVSHNIIGMFWIRQVGWYAVHPMFYLFPWALGPILSWLLPVVIWVIATLCSVYEYTLGLANYNLPEHSSARLSLGGLHNLFYLGGSVVVVPVLFYYYGRRKLSVEPEYFKTRVTSTEKGACLCGQGWPTGRIALACMCVPVIVEVLGQVIAYPDWYPIFAASLYFVAILIILVVNLNMRRLIERYSFTHYITYSAFLLYGSYGLGESIALLFSLLGDTSEAIDTFLPLIFILHKGYFGIIRAVAVPVTSRMGPETDQVRWIYAIQFMNNLILDTYSILSPKYSWYFIIFCVLRSVSDIFFHGEVGRAITDYYGLTKPEFGISLNNRAKNGGAASPSASKPVDSTETDVPDKLAATPRLVAPPFPAKSASIKMPRLHGFTLAPIEAPSTPTSLSPSSTTAAVGPSLPSALQAALRRPYGHTPVTQLLHWAQDSLATLCSLLAMLALLLIDLAFPNCYALCYINFRTPLYRLLTLAAFWVPTTVTTFSLIRWKLSRYGIKTDEIIPILQAHFVPSVRLLALLVSFAIGYQHNCTLLLVVHVNKLGAQSVLA